MFIGSVHIYTKRAYSLKTYMFVERGKRLAVKHIHRRRHPLFFGRLPMQSFLMFRPMFAVFVYRKLRNTFLCFRLLKNLACNESISDPILSRRRRRSQTFLCLCLCLFATTTTATKSINDDSRVSEKADLCLYFVSRDPNSRRKGGRQSTGSIQWPIFTPSGKHYLQLNARYLDRTLQANAVGRGPRSNYCAFWAEYLPQVISTTGWLTQPNSTHDFLPLLLLTAPMLSLTFLSPPTILPLLLSFYISLTLLLFLFFFLIHRSPDVSFFGSIFSRTFVT